MDNRDGPLSDPGDPGISVFLGICSGDGPASRKRLGSRAVARCFFLISLVFHGTCQQWWLEPILGQLSEWPLMIGATILTGFNDNAAITYLASLVPNFSEQLKYAVMAGAVTGGD